MNTAPMETISIRQDLKMAILEQVATTGRSPSDVIDAWRLAAATPANGKAQQDGDDVAPLVKFLDDDGLRRKRKAIDRFMAILSFLYEVHGEEIENALDVRGHRRQYFSKDADTLRRSGVSVNPRRVPGSPFWAITRLSNRDKRVILDRVLHSLGYDQLVRERLFPLFESS